MLETILYILIWGTLLHVITSRVLNIKFSTWSCLFFALLAAFLIIINNHLNHHEFLLDLIFEHSPYSYFIQLCIYALFVIVFFELAEKIDIGPGRNFARNEFTQMVARMRAGAPCEFHKDELHIARTKIDAEHIPSKFIYIKSISEHYFLQLATEHGEGGEKYTSLSLYCGRYVLAIWDIEKDTIIWE